jgi:uncharacterized membrane protein
MGFPEQPGAMFALLAVFVFVGFLFLLVIAKGRLSERQETVAWVAFTVLFFSVCSVLVRGNAQAQTAHRVNDPTSLVDGNQADIAK